MATREEKQESLSEPLNTGPSTEAKLEETIKRVEALEAEVAALKAKG